MKEPRRWRRCGITNGTDGAWKGGNEKGEQLQGMVGAAREIGRGQ